MKSPIRPMIRAPRSQRGATLIEVLVSLIILMVGLLGLVGVMIQSQRSQVESYQRVQALMLVQDIASRISTNKAAASCYVLASYIGTGNETVPSTSACTLGTADQQARVTQDLTEWRDLLLGAAELSGTDKVGGMLGARGCVTFDAATNLYQVSIAWQGGGQTAAPPAGVLCGKDLYGDDSQRRAVSLTVMVPSFS